MVMIIGLYETSWLNKNGKPNNRILNISYKCNSKFFVESKSLKLYLYSLNNKKFNELTEVEQLIKTDLEEALKTEVYIELNELPRKLKKIPTL